MGDILHVRDEQTTGTEGGASSATTDHTRVLNTVVTNTIAGSSLATNQITLPAGTYDVFGSAPAWDLNRHRTLLYNTSDSAVEVLGPSGYLAAAGDDNGQRSVVFGRFTIATSKTFELRMYSQTAAATSGLGKAVGDGRTEIYADVLIQKVA